MREDTHMICTKCGAEVADGMRFCTTCGTPIAAPVEDAGDKTVLISQDMDLSVQPNNNPLGQTTAPQNTQFTNQPQMAAPYTGQPMAQGMNTQYTGHPMAQGMNTQYTGQPQMTQGMNTQYTGQPQMAAPYAGQPMAQGMNTQYTGQPQMTQGMYTQQPYGQPNMMYNQAPKPPKKPLSPQAKKGLIIGGIAVAVLAVFFLVVWPILTRSKLQGEYKCRDSYSVNTIIFDDGSYAIYDEDGEGIEAGTYVLKDDKIKMVSLNGVETTGTFDAKENKIKLKYHYSTYKYSSSDEEETLGIKITTTYIEDLEEKVADATEQILGDLDTYDYYYITDDDLADSYGFEEELAKALNYENDPTLQLLLEDEFMSISIEVYYGDLEVEVYAWY